MRIHSVAFNNYPPFSDAVIRFPATQSGRGDVQLLTGQNGTGKTRLLNLLAVACGHQMLPDQRLLPPRPHAAVAFFDGPQSRFCWNLAMDEFAEVPQEADDEIDRLKFQPERWESERIDSASAVTLVGVALKHAGLEQFATMIFRGGASIDDVDVQALAPIKLGNEFEASLDDSDANSRMLCQSIANLKLEAGMEKLEQKELGHQRAISLIERLELAIANVTDRSFMFHLELRPQCQLCVYWGGVRMSIRQLPDGLRSIIGWMALAVSRLNAKYPDHPDPLSIPLILLLDEPETHLHPAWQRKVIPAAKALFPEAQIIVATHSPFVISSVNDGFIHVFRAKANGEVVVDAPHECSQGDSWIDAVEDVLGVSEWYDPETEQLLSQFRTARDSVLTGGSDFDALQELATTIGERSESLANLMGREMRQVVRFREQRASHEKATASAEA